MAIKDKNGKILRLSHPNPLRQVMNEWDKEYVEIFNFDNHINFISKSSGESSIKTKPTPAKEEKSKSFKNQHFEDLLSNSSSSSTTPTLNVPQQIQEFEIEIPVVQVEKESTTDPVVPQSNFENDVLSKARAILEKNGNKFHCAPVVGKKEIQDELYGTNFLENIYGEPFIFYAMPMNQTDLTMSIWCIDNLSLGSIILKIVSRGGERWWKIHDIKPERGGYLCTAIVSDINPNF